MWHPARDSTVDSFHDFPAQNAAMHMADFEISWFMCRPMQTSWLGGLSAQGVEGNQSLFRMLTTLLVCSFESSTQ